MKRKLTTREWMLLGVFAILAIGCAYIMLFYNPTTSARDTALAEAESCREQTQAAKVRLEEKQRMERELDEIFAGDSEPTRLEDYDNLQQVMMDLRLILEDTNGFDLNFSTVDASQKLVRREINIDFDCANYDKVKSVLYKLYNISYRCMLNNVNITLGDTKEDKAHMKGSIVFFELQTQ